MQWERLDYILKNEKRYRKILENDFLKASSINEISVQNNNINTKESMILDYWESKEYKQALKIVKAIDKFLNNSTEIYVDIYVYKYRKLYSIPQIARAINYSESSVKKKINKIRKRIWRDIGLKCPNYPI